MLPIDEHAKSGAWVYVRNAEKDPLRKVRFSSHPEGDWLDERGDRWYLSKATHYLPASWVENAAKMWEALVRIEREPRNTMSDRKAVGYMASQARRIIAATEWPEVKGE